MTISEKTKQVVAQQKSTLKQRYQANLVDIQEHKDAIAIIQAANVALKAAFDALDKDIPAPTPEV